MGVISGASRRRKGGSTKYFFSIYNRIKNEYPEWCSSLKFPQEYIDNVGRAAEFSYTKILRVFFLVTGIVIPCTAVSALLWFLGYLPYKALLFAVAFSAMIIICLLILWIVLWYRTVNAKQFYEWHNRYYALYKPQGLWYKFHDLPLHSNKYAIIMILAILLYVLVVIVFFKK